MCKRLLCLLTSVFLFIAGSQSVRAENVSVIRSLYNATEQVVNLDEYREQFDNAIEEYQNTFQQYESSRYAKEKNEAIIQTIGKETAKAESDVKEWSHKLDACYEQLTHSVNHDAALDTIISYESQYIQIRKTLQEHLNHRASLRELLLALGTIDSEVRVIDDQQLFDTYEIIIQMRAQLDDAGYTEIGDVTNVQVPISTGVYQVNSRFGARINPFNSEDYQNHYGLDLDASYGDYNLALFNGTVLVTNYSETYGNYVILDHGHGVRSLYAHAVKNLVEEGEYVTQYQKIQETGSTGASTGPHLHLALMIDGSFVDPAILFER